MIFAHDLLRSGSGFGSDTNAVTIIERSGRGTESPTMPKAVIAASIMTAISALAEKQNS